MFVGSQPPETQAADPTLESRSYDLYLLAPLLFALSITLQGMTTLIYLFGPNDKAQPPGLVEVGRMASRPERDIPIFAAASVVALLAMLLCAHLWRRFIRSVDKSARPRLMKTSAGTLLFLALGSFLLYILMLGARFVFTPTDHGLLRTPASILDAFTIWLPILLAIFCASWELLDQRKNLIIPPRPTRPRSRAVAWTINLLILLTVAAAIYIPIANWPALAGSFFLPDQMHHWNYFGMGPALKWAHGKAFDRDFYAQYGMGWPVTFVFLARWLPLSYANMVGEGIAAAALYYCFLYLLLLQLFRKPSWGLIALMLVLLWQVYVDTDARIWQTPSSTVLRNPFDIFCFSCLLLHRQSGKNFWLVIAGALLGLAIFFELDTGIYLAITLAFYCTICLTFPPKAIDKKHQLRWQIFANALPLMGALVILLPTFYLGSRGSFLHADFWNGWLEGITNQAVDGNSMLPMALNRNDDLLFFLAQITVYLMTIGYALITILRRTASSRSIVYACIAVYGMGSILLFVGRSHPLNLLHPTTPFAILLVAILFAAREHVRAAFNLRFNSLAPALAFLLCIFLITSNEFLSYPSAITQLFSGQPAPAGVTIFPDRNDLADVTDIAGKGPAIFFASEIQAVCARAKALSANHDTVVFFDIIDTTLYYGSDLEPWSRYHSLFRQILTQNFLAKVNNDLITQHPRYVFIRSGAARDFGPEQDVWQSLHDTLSAHYTLLDHVGTFDLYEYPQPPPHGPPS